MNVNVQVGKGLLTSIFIIINIIVILTYYNISILIKLVVLRIHVFSFALFLIEFQTLVDCVWGNFGDWGRCSASCGNGKTTRTRAVSTPASGGGKPCNGKSTEETTCNEGECPGGYNFP